MKIYTRRGDDGSTALFGGGRTSKDDARVEAYGTVDELNAVIGSALSHVTERAIARRLGRIQSDLFAIGAHLATPPPTGTRRGPALPDLPAQRIAAMESWIDEAMSGAPPIRNFILPAGSPGAGCLHVARAVCRRAERRVVTLAASSPVDADVIRYLNRLSDYLFAAARHENAAAGGGEVEWRT